MIIDLSVPISASATWAYIGPGAGFALAGSFFAVLAAIFSAVLLLFTWPIRWLVRVVRGRQALKRSRVKRFVILGLDGLDYRLTHQFLAQGKLPHLDALRRQGCFLPLGSTIPPISPVAWSSFQTGVNPGKHNMFDFLTPDLRTYQPKLSSVEIRSPSRMLRLGKYQVPLGRAGIRLLRKSVPFWQILGQHGVFSSVIRVPITFPPEKHRGVMLAAMCVPDLRGTQGMFSFFTTRPQPDGEQTGGETCLVTRRGKVIEAHLIGPENPFRKDNAPVKLPFTVTVQDASSALLNISGIKVRLRKDRYSDWIRVAFRLAPGFKVYGQCKFLLRETEPEFELYVTPINIDPERPVMPVSHPSIYSTYLAKRQGTFATLGLAEDTWALNEGILDDETFLQQCLDADQERELMFFDSLDKVKQGLCAVVFDGTDRVQHTFWRDTDAPLVEDDNAPQKPTRVLEELYLRMDDLVGRTVAACNDPESVLMVISDHGFNSFRRGIDLNRWLHSSGYLTLKDDADLNAKHLEAVDWSQTRAFAIGLAGIFLNVKGRQSQGIVNPGKEAAALAREIAANLAAMIDPEDGRPAMHRVHLAADVYRGPYTEAAPDLIVGYARGYRASWETAIGQITDEVFHTNTKAWSGDHCIDHSLVPGVLFCNRRVETAINQECGPRLMDIGPTVLEMFGVKIPAYMDGKPLVLAEAEGSGQ